MRLSAPTPTAEPLPLYASHHQPAVGRPSPPRARLTLHGDAIARFDAFLHELNPDAARVDIDRMQYLLDWLLTFPDADAHGMLDRRLRRIDELRAMLADPDWDADDAMRARLGKLFAYLEREHPLASDQPPLLGLLDDILLIELAWPAFANEADQYRDFCLYRNDEHPDGGGEERRHAWVRDRLAELALWQHQARVNDSHYTWRGHPESMFRVG